MSEGRQPPETIGNRLDEVAKILAGSLIAVAGLLTAFGLTSERALAALNNSQGPLILASVLAIFAVLCSILAFFCSPSPRGNKKETIILLFGMGFYVAALMVALAGAAREASGNGRPAITSIRIEGRRPVLSLTFTVRADGVRRNARVVVSVRPLAPGDNQGTAGSCPGGASSGQLYAGTLRPDDKGVVEHEVATPLLLVKASRLAVVASSISRRKGDAWAKPPACAVLTLP
jgi:hypothetical protein